MKGFHLLVRALCVRSIKDTQCGFKLFTRDTARVLFNNLHVDRWYPLTSSYTPTPPYSSFNKIIFFFSGRSTSICCIKRRVWGFRSPRERWRGRKSMARRSRPSVAGCRWDATCCWSARDTGSERGRSEPNQSSIRWKEMNWNCEKHNEQLQNLPRLCKLFWFLIINWRYNKRTA